ncbi:MAG: radical SAM protein [Candidatus Nanoarchaeia archaeon]|nr:radical SAM protein [Candidatus Nanoarchaeia archaeon]MDD5741685.1 radical SAM protein [Candidatus Nanoarchaeia archaeon]
MKKITKQSSIALVEPPPTQHGVLDGKPSYDEYSRVTKRLPSRALPTLEGVLLDNGYENINSTPYSSDVVCISAITRTAKQSLEYATKLKLNNPEVKIVFGGAHFTVRYEEALENGGDVVVLKEGEHLSKVLNTGFDYEKLSQVKGIAYRQENRIILTEPRPLLTPEQLSSIHPYYDKALRKSTNIAVIETMRGCPYHCEQCQVTDLFGGSFRAKSIEWDIKELRRINDIGPTIFYISDNIAGNPKHLNDLSLAIEEEGLNKKFGVCQISAKSLRNPKVVESLKRMGIRMVCVGYESMNPEFLTDIRKPCSVEDNNEAARILKEAKIWNHGMIMTGGKDTKQSLEYELQWTIKNLDSAQFFPIGNIPGTKFDKRMREEGRILCEDYSKIDGHHVLVRPENLSPYELQIITNDMYYKFYSFSNNLKRIIKSPSKGFAIALGIYTNFAGGVSKVLNSPQMRDHLEFLKSVS